MDEAKWTDSQLRIAFEGGNKYQNFNDLVEHLEDMDMLGDVWQNTEKTSNNNLAKFSKMIANQKDCPPEFVDIVNKEFWNLI